jgi:Family of unknown function (DUF6527)
MCPTSKSSPPSPKTNMPKARLQQLPTGTRVVFRCPGCLCPHAVYIQRRGTGSERLPIWMWNESLEQPSLHPSVLVMYPDGPPPDRPAKCHGTVRLGRIVFGHDCDHELRDRTVDLPELSC